jgi:hypothetical protein
MPNEIILMGICLDIIYSPTSAKKKKSEGRSIGTVLASQKNIYMYLILIKENKSIISE